MNIRRAISADAEALARVNVDSWRAAYRGLVPDSHLDGLSHERAAQRFREGIVSGDEIHVVEQSDEILGFLALGGCRDPDVDTATTGEIWGIYLSPQHWRSGLGRQLCRRAEQMLISRHCEQAVLWVLEGNMAARRFYEAMGFQVDGASKSLSVGAPLQAVRYRKPLKPADSSSGNTAQPHR